MELSPYFKALADESRIRILGALHLGALNLQELTTLLELSQPTVSHHVKILEQHSFLTRSRQGTWFYFSLPKAHEHPLIDQLLKTLLSYFDNPAPQNSVFESDRVAVKKILEIRRQKQDQFFEKVAPEWEQLKAEAPAMNLAHSELSKRIREFSGTVVDLGCGTGRLLKDSLPRSGRTIGIDASAAMLEEANHSGKEIDFRLGSLEHLPLADNEAELIIAHMVLHHLSHPKSALGEIHRVLRPGGTCLIAELTSHQSDHFREQFGDFWLGFDPKEIVTWLSENGLTVQESKLLGDQNEAFFITATKN